MKTGAVAQGEGFCNFLFQKRASKRSKQKAVFNFVAGNATKIGVSESFVLKNLIYDDLRFSFFSYIFLTRKYPAVRVSGSC